MVTAVRTTTVIAAPGVPGDEAEAMLTAVLQRRMAGENHLDQTFVTNYIEGHYGIFTS
jgi:molybdopterin-biosynthesis enzyme MoeA-like protein